MNKIAKRSISFVTAMFMSIMSIVTGISPVSAKDIPNIKGENPIDDVTLLVGDDTTNKLRAATVEDTLKNYRKEYLLGIASQFSVFTYEDFEVSDSDAEGRVAIGGDFINSTAWQSYAVGKGDFLEHTSLEKLLGSKNYAHVILNGELKNGKLADSYYDEDDPYKGNRTEGMGESVAGEKKS